MTVSYSIPLHNKSRGLTLDSHRREAPACLILDVDLPGLSGFELQRVLTEVKRPIPIIFITGRGTLPMAANALQAGAAAFLTKPFEAYELFDALEEAFTRAGRASV